MNTTANDITYQPTHPFVLDSALWKDAVWRLHGIPGELEASHITMLQTETTHTIQSMNGAETGNQLFLQLTIHQPSYLSIVWDKFTSNYRNLWKTVPYNRYFINSVFIATASTLLTLFFCSLGGYAFAKYQFRGQKILFGILLASMMVPFQVLLVPLFGLMYDVGWLNSYKAIIIPFSVGAFGVFLMRQFYRHDSIGVDRRCPYRRLLRIWYLLSDCVTYYQTGTRCIDHLLVFRFMERLSLAPHYFTR